MVTIMKTERLIYEMSTIQNIISLKTVENNIYYCEFILNYI